MKTTTYYLRAAFAVALFNLWGCSEPDEKSGLGWGNDSAKEMTKENRSIPLTGDKSIKLALGPENDSINDLLDPTHKRHNEIESGRLTHTVVTP